MKKHIIAIIPARGGSKGLPRKNIRPLLGKPLIAYTIEAAKGCDLIDRVIVSTEDEEIASISKEYGAEVPFLRPSELAGDSSTTESVLKHALEWLERDNGYSIDIVVFLQATDIFRKKSMIRQVIENLLDDEALESSFVAYPTHKNFWKNENGTWVKLTPKTYGPRQKRQPIYREDTGIACATRASLIREGRRLGDKVKIVVNDDDVSGVDIHDELDLWISEQLLKNKKRTIND